MRRIRIIGLAAAMMATLLASIASAQTTNNKTEETELRVEAKSIPFKVVYEFSRDVRGGSVVTSRRGLPGQVRRTYTVTRVNGKVVSKKLLDEERVEPVDEIVLMSRMGYTTSRSSFSRGKVMVMAASAYDPSPQTIPGTKGITASGLRAGYGVAAVDPRVIPLGTLLYIEGYGFAIAADTGGAIKGNRIDLCYNSRSTALRFGRRKVVVHVLGKR